MKLHFFDDDKAFVLLHKLEDLGAFEKLILSDPAAERRPWDQDSVLDLCAQAQILVRNAKHGKLGPDHAGTALVDYAYQAEMHVQDTAKSRPEIVRWELWDDEHPFLHARWERRNGRVAMTLRAEWYEGEWQLGVTL